MKRARHSFGVVAIALLISAVAADAGTVNVSVLGSPVTVTAGSEATVQLAFTVWGSNNPNGIPAVSYCETVMLNADGTFSCAPDALVLNAGQNYTVKGTPTKITRDVRIVVAAGAPCGVTTTYSMRLAVNPGTGLSFGNNVQEVWVNVTLNVQCPAPSVILGCGHGYWKNHPAQWPVGYGDKSVGELFELPEDYSDIASDSLMTALNYPTGRSDTVVGKGKILLVQAVAAYLNAVTFGGSFPQPAATVYQNVNNALAIGDKDQLTALGRQYDDMNNAYCPLP